MKKNFKASENVAKYDLQKFRRERSLTQIQLAKALGVSQGFLSGMETGRNPFPEERRKNFAEAFPDVDLEAYLLPEKELVKGTTTEYEDLEAARNGVQKMVREVRVETGESKREDAAEKEKAAHRRSPEFKKYLDAVTFIFDSNNPDFELPTMKERLADLLEENDNLSKWNDELREKADGLRDQLDESRNELFKTQQEVIRLQRLLLKNKIDF